MDNSDANGCLILGLTIVTSLVIGALVYLGGGWIVYDIYRSFDPVEMNETLQDVEMKKLEIYAYVVIGYFFLLGLIFDLFDKVKGFFWIAFIPLLLMTLLKLVIPMSVGAAIINSIICIGVCAFATYLAIIGILD